MAGTSLTDILTSAQNVVQAINNAATTILRINGTGSSMAITTPTLVKASAGRIVTASVIVAGSATGMIYDANALGVTTYPAFVVPMTVGVFPINLSTNFGILVVPGTGQTVSVGYS